MYLAGMKANFQKLFFSVSTFVMLYAVILLAKGILIPLSSALLLAFILFPVLKKIRKLVGNTILSAFLSFFLLFLGVAGVLYFFSSQIIYITQDIEAFRESIIQTFTQVTLYLNEYLPLIDNLNKEKLLNEAQSWLSTLSGSLVKQTFNNTTTFITGLVATIIFAFLFLIYHRALTEATVSFVRKEHQNAFRQMLRKIQKVGEKYVLGMVVMVMIIGLINSIGLLIIGINNPFLFGFFGAALSVIPYVGTTVGALIPVLYAFIAYDPIWMPIAVAILFWAVQLLTDNFLSPKIVGGSLNINALTAILSLIIGAASWGLAGMILFLPFAAMLKVIFEQYDELKPLAALMSNDYYQSNAAASVTPKWVLRLKKVFKKDKT